MTDANHTHQEHAPVHETTTHAPEAASHLDIKNTQSTIDVVDMKFSFRTLKDKETGVETKRETVEAKLNIPSFDGIVEILQSRGKGYELLRTVMTNTLADYAKDILAESPNITSENFPSASVSWEILANLPESERKGRGIPKETWEDFLADYISVMPAATGKTKEQVEKQAAILGQKLQPLKTHIKKDVIVPNMKAMMNIYVNTSGKAEQFVDCIEFLQKKADAILAGSADTDLTANLGF